MIDDKHVIVGRVVLKEDLVLNYAGHHSTNSDAEKAEPDSERRPPSAKKRSRVEEVTNANTVADTKNGSW
jgi:hypothetical protein